jgi:hypothetical protein
MPNIQLDNNDSKYKMGTEIEYQCILKKCLNQKRNVESSKLIKGFLILSIKFADDHLEINVLFLT